MWINLILELWSLLCVLVPCLLLQWRLARSGRIRFTKAHLVWTWVFLLYLHMTFSVAGFGSVWDIGKFGAIVRPEEINLIPFQSEGVLTYALNVIMFMPLGFLLPLIWRRYGPKRTVLTGGALSLMIELGQLVNRRNTDIDDLIMNLLGTLFGYFVWKLYCRVFHGRGLPKENGSPWEPFLYIILGALGRFLFFHWRLGLRLLRY